MYRLKLELRECANSLCIEINSRKRSTRRIVDLAERLISLKRTFMDYHDDSKESARILANILRATLSQVSPSRLEDILMIDEQEKVLTLIPTWFEEARRWKGKRRTLKASPFSLERRDKEKLSKDIASYLVPMGSLEAFQRDPFASRVLQQVTNSIVDEESKRDIVYRVRVETTLEKTFFMRRHPPSPHYESKNEIIRKFSDLRIDIDSPTSDLPLLPQKSATTEGVLLYKPKHRSVSPEPFTKSSSSSSCSKRFVENWRKMHVNGLVEIDCNIPDLETIETAMRLGVRPQAVNVQCTGGAYFMRNQRRRIVAVFKPNDEEPYAPNNPSVKYRRSESKELKDGMKRGIRVGEAAGRECAAYLLDHESFAGVPATSLVSIRHPRWKDCEKIGSLQSYVQHFCSAEDVGYSRFLEEDVHRIAILDMRLLNCDRHSGNVLVSHQPEHIYQQNHRRHQNRGCKIQLSKSEPMKCLTPDPSTTTTLWTPDESEMMNTTAGATNVTTRASTASRSTSYEDYSPTNKDSRRRRHGVVKLIPIDHGFTLPRVDALSDASFEWLGWPQARKPFSETMLSYIRDLDAEMDVRILNRYRTPCSSSSLKIEHRSLLTLRVCTSWLKQCASNRMTPYEIGRTMCRSSKLPAEPSVLETLVSKSSRIVNIDLSHKNVMNHQETAAFMRAFSKVSKERLSSFRV